MVRMPAFTSIHCCTRGPSHCNQARKRSERSTGQERANKTKKAKNTDKEITNLLDFKKRHAYA